MAENAEELEDNFNDDSFIDEPSASDDDSEEDSTVNDPVARLLKQLQSSGALVKKTTIHKCYKCNETYPSREDLLEHIIDHVCLPDLILEKVQVDDNSDDEEEWYSEEEKSDEEPPKPLSFNSKIDISKFLEAGKGLTITSNKTLGDPLQSLKNFGGICIKKVVQSDKKSTPERSSSMSPDSAKMESSGTLKLTIKHTSDNKSFQVINGPPKGIKTELDDDMDIDETIDIKAGILEHCLNTKIKTEPDSQQASKNSNSETVVQSDLPATGQVKREVRSRPTTPVQTENNDSNQIKVKNFALEHADKKPQVIEAVPPKPILIPKVEKDVSAIIEINCDDEDDDEIIFVGASTLPEKKPAPANEPPKPVHTPSKPPPVSSASAINSRSHTSLSTTEKQHSFNWNAPSKSNDIIESISFDKNHDVSFESFLQSPRKDDCSDMETSEYISLDKLGPQHTCEVCNTRYTSLYLLDQHRKSTGHSNQLVTSNSSSSSMQLASYQQPGFLMNSLLPVKQLAETVSKIATGNSSGSGYTHQQNIMVNIQSFPGNMNQPGMQPQTHQPGYNYPGMPNVPPNAYPQNAYRMPNNPNMAPNYPGQYQQTTYPNSYPGYPPAQPAYSQMNLYPTHPNQQPFPHGQYPTQSSGGQILNPYSQGQVQPPHNQLPINSNPNQILSPNASVGQTIIPLSSSGDPNHQNNNANAEDKNMANGIKIQNVGKPLGPRIIQKADMRGQVPIRGVRRGRGMGPSMGSRPIMKQGVQVAGAVRGPRPGMIRGGAVKRPASATGQPSPSKKRMDMLLPDRHDNEDCQVVSLQQQRDGLPLIQSIQGNSRNSVPAGVQLSNEITWTKKKVEPSHAQSVSKDTNAMASMLASRGIKITQKQKPAVNIPNLGSNISITATKSSSFNIPEEEFTCKFCVNKTFSNQLALSTHMKNYHSSQMGSTQNKCDSCPASYPTYNQLLEHKRMFHNNPNAEFGLPVVDLTSTATIRKLSSLGIVNFIPLASRSGSGSTYGLPIVSAQGALNGTLSNALGSLGSEGILSLGPVKPLSKIV